MKDGRMTKKKGESFIDQTQEQLISEKAQSINKIKKLPLKLKHG